MSAVAKLASRGITVQQAKDYILANLNDPVSIFNAAKAVGLTTLMLGEIAGVPVATVKNYFDANRVDWAKLNPAKTGSVFLTDLSDGDVFLYNPSSQTGKKIYSFGREITDIAVDEGGNIFVTGFQQLWKYDITDQTLKTLSFHNANLNSLVVLDNSVVGASATSNLIYKFDSTSGATVSIEPSFGGASAGDLAYVENTLFKASTGSGIVSVQGQTGSNVAASISSDFWGLVQTPEGNLQAYSNAGNVKNINLSTGAVSDLPQVKLVGLSTLSGAAEALDIHLSLFL